MADAADGQPAASLGPASGPARDAATPPLRLTWVQPEDLLGHELRQAAEDGRDATAIERTWLAAGGALAPERAGASPQPADPQLRGLAAQLLDELALLPSPLTTAEPTGLAAIKAACPSWPARPAGDTVEGVPDAADPEVRDRDRDDASEDDSAHVPGRGTDGSRAHGGSAGPFPLRGDGGTGAPNPPPTLAGQGEPPGAATRPPAAGLTPGAGEDGKPQSGNGPEGSDGPATRPKAGHAPARGDAGDAAAGHPAPETPAREGDPRGSSLRDRLEAGWLGRAAGCLLGKPVEKLPLAGIRELARATGNWPLDDWFTQVRLPAEVAERWPWNRRSGPTSLAENIDGMPEDDDLNYPLLGLLLLQRHGHGFSTGDVAKLWLDELPAGRTFTAERVAYRNLLDGLEPPHTASHHNPFREWIGARIRADIFGWTHPGDPAKAAELAWRDATLSHTACGVHGALFVAAAVAAATGGTRDVLSCLRAGLSVVPQHSRLARAVSFGIGAALAEPTGTSAGFATVVDRLHDAYGHHHWVHVLPNAALLAAALTHADGDFTGSICRAVSGGWDTDSNGATAGSIAGLLAGSPGALPARWTAPLKNRLATSVGGFDGVGFDTLAHLTADLARAPAAVTQSPSTPPDRQETSEP